MDAWIVHEAAIRYYLLIGSFGLVAVWEALAPRRIPRPPVAGRWAINIGLTTLLSGVVIVVFPVLTVGAALVAERSAIGLFNVVQAPAWLAFAVSLLALDAGRYGLHALLHRVPWLWRLHRVHHSDVDFDCTTALRFHPLEALVTVAVQLALVAAIGAPALAVLAYEVAAAFISLFSHGNVRIARERDGVLRRFVVTPDMHRIHHSATLTESNTNFGSVLPWWDRLFGTYRAEPASGDGDMTIGLADVRDARTRQLGWLLASPFRRSSVPAA